MNKIALAKNAASVVIAAGTTKIVNGIISNNVVADKKTDEVTIAAASVVIGMMVADKTTAYTSALIDQAADWYAKNVKK